MSKKMRASLAVGLFGAMPLIYKLTFIAWRWAGADAQVMAWLSVVIASTAACSFALSAAGVFDA